ncbi:glycosyltransferase [Rhodobacteraceae bacterium S2214]|nr:glycosyltransferase [Rhodobacteraceae bacterium S2214]
MPRFSVVIACYNATETLAETLASLQSQDEQDWEAICVDDGSTDATLDMLHAAAASDPRIHVIGKPNEGPSIARNVGAASANADWIAFLDSDDIWVPQKLSHIAQVAATSPEADGIYGRIAFFEDSSAADTTTSTVKAGQTSLEDLLGENPVCTLSNLCVRRAAFLELKGFREDMRYSEDLEFLVRFVASGKTLVATPFVLVRYRASNNGLSANLMQMHEGWREAVASAGHEIADAQRDRAEALHLRYLARRALRLNIPPKSAFQLALAGFKLSPLAFLGDGHRGPATFVSCLFAPLIPAPLRRSFFA